jgi:hypothetical protein
MPLIQMCVTLVIEHAPYLLGAPASGRLTVAATMVGVTDLAARDDLLARCRRSQRRCNASPKNERGLRRSAFLMSRRLLNW